MPRARSSRPAFGVAPVALDAAIDRLGQQGAASALWIELDDDGVQGRADLDRLIDRANAEAAAGRFPAIVAAPAALLDPPLRGSTRPTARS